MASAIAVLIGIPLGVTLTVTARGAMLENQPVNHVLGAIINATRSVPFVILMVAIIPFTRLVAQTSIGTTAAIVPLSVAAIPFMARIAENAMREVDPGVTAARAMGASPMQIIVKVLLPEALPGLIAATIVTIVSLIGYSAMAGAIGGGGLGDRHPLRLPAFPDRGHGGGGGGADRAGAGHPELRRPSRAPALAPLSPFFPTSDIRDIRNMSIKVLKSLAAFALGAAVFAQPALAQDKPLKVGVTAGPHAQIFEVVQQEAAKQGLNIQIIEFSDYVQPNVALSSGDLDLNSYQHQPYRTTPMPTGATSWSASPRP